AGNAAGDVGPDVAQGDEVFVVDLAAAAVDAQRVAGIQFPDTGDAGLESVRAQNAGDLVEVGGADLDDRAEFFAEEGGEFAVAGGHFDVDAGVAGEGHLDEGGEQAAVGTVVVGEDFLL